MSHICVPISYMFYRKVLDNKRGKKKKQLTDIDEKDIEREQKKYGILSSFESLFIPFHP